MIAKDVYRHMAKAENDRRGYPQANKFLPGNPVFISIMCR